MRIADEAIACPAMGNLSEAGKQRDALAESSC